MSDKNQKEGKKGKLRLVQYSYNKNNSRSSGKQYQSNVLRTKWNKSKNITDDDDERTHHTRRHGVRLIQAENACIDTKNRARSKNEK